MTAGTFSYRYRSRIAEAGAVEPLVALLREEAGEAQGYAAATLCGLAQIEEARDEIVRSAGVEPLVALTGGAGWLKAQAEEILRLMGYADRDRG